MNLSPSSDFYKTLALECSTQQIGVDLFVLTGQYVDLATICKFLNNLMRHCTVHAGIRCPYPSLSHS